MKKSETEPKHSVTFSTELGLALGSQYEALWQPIFSPKPLLTPPSYLLVQF
jgi:hypothetical protein